MILLIVIESILLVLWWRKCHYDAGILKCQIERLHQSLLGSSGLEVELKIKINFLPIILPSNSSRSKSIFDFISNICDVIIHFLSRIVTILESVA